MQRLHGCQGSTEELSSQIASQLLPSEQWSDNTATYFVRNNRVSAMTAFSIQTTFLSVAKRL